MKKDKDLVLMCEGGCYEHNIVFRQIYNPHDPTEQNEVYVGIHIDKPGFWKRLRYAITGKFSKGWSEYVETITTKEKLQNIVNQLE